MNTIRMMDRIASVKRFSPKKVRLHFVYKLFVLDVRISIVPEIQSVILKKSLFRRRTPNFKLSSYLSLLVYNCDRGRRQQRPVPVPLQTD